MILMISLAISSVGATQTIKNKQKYYNPDKDTYTLPGKDFSIIWTEYQYTYRELQSVKKYAHKKQERVKLLEEELVECEKQKRFSQVEVILWTSLAVVVGLGFGIVLF